MNKANICWKDLYNVKHYAIINKNKRLLFQFNIIKIYMFTEKTRAEYENDLDRARDNQLNAYLEGCDNDDFFNDEVEITKEAYFDDSDFDEDNHYHVIHIMKRPDPIYRVIRYIECDSFGFVSKKRMVVEPNDWWIEKQRLINK